MWMACQTQKQIGVMLGVARQTVQVWLAPKTVHNANDGKTHNPKDVRNGETAKTHPPRFPSRFSFATRAGRA